MASHYQGKDQPFPVGSVPAAKTLFDHWSKIFTPKTINIDKATNLLAKFSNRLAPDLDWSVSFDLTVPRDLTAFRCPIGRLPIWTARRSFSTRYSIWPLARRTFLLASTTPTWSFSPKRSHQPVAFTPARLQTLAPSVYQTATQRSLRLLLPWSLVLPWPCLPFTVVVYAPGPTLCSVPFRGLPPSALLRPLFVPVPLRSRAPSALPDGRRLRSTPSCRPLLPRCSWRFCPASRVLCADVLPAIAGCVLLLRS